MKIKNTC